MINARRHHTQLQDRRLRYAKLMSGKANSKLKIPYLMVILHIPLGLLLYRSSALALLYPAAIFFIGMYYAVNRKVKLDRVAYVTAYLVGAEVLCRMAQSSIFWEFGKYGTAAIMIVALFQRRYLKFPTLPSLYFVCLIPACIMTLMNNDLSEARSKLSFNMSGPLLLFISCWFFSHLKVNTFQLKQLIFLIALPIVSIAVTTLFHTVTIENIQFTGESNFSTSGGFGPNQVSSVLGLGVFVCLACYLLFKNSFRETICLGILCVLFATQSVMTFSRGGIYSAVGATLVVIILQMQNLNQAVKRLFPVVGIGLMFLLLIFPFLDDFTGGKLQERFEETGTTNRTEIIESDLQLLNENPILGTGVGEAKAARAEFLDFKAASHTEFSRVVSEHGLIGIFALIALALATIYNFRRQNSIISKAFVTGVVIWSFLFMLNAGMRLAAPSFMWGLSFLTILLPQIRKKRL